MKAIIFGITGQDGHYLNELLCDKGIEVIGVSRTNPKWIVGDISDFDFVKELVRKTQASFIFHLAANSTTRHEATMDNHAAISTGTLNLLEAVLQFSPNTKVFLSGSGLQFVNKSLPISEADPFDATSGYSLSRIHSVYAARYYRTLGLKVYVGYFFNHDSPLRSEKHVNQKIAKAVKRIANGSAEMIELFDISIRKEFSFAGDIAEAIFLLVSNDVVFEAVIGSGKAYRIEDWLRVCFDYYGLDWRTKVREGIQIKKEYDILVSDPKTIFSLGWKPKVDMDGLAKLMIETN